MSPSSVCSPFPKNATLPLSANGLLIEALGAYPKKTEPSGEIMVGSGGLKLTLRDIDGVLISLSGGSVGPYVADFYFGGSLMRSVRGLHGVYDLPFYTKGVDFIELASENGEGSLLFACPVR